MRMNEAKRWAGLRRRAAAWMLSGLMACGLAAHAQDTEDLYSESFESANLLDDWTLTGDWRFRTNSACLPNDLGYVTPSTALVFDYGSECGYRNNRSGFATMDFDVSIPIIYPEVRLEWWDFVGAETGRDFYFVQLSTDGGATWPYEIYRDSVDETFWDIEQVDLTPFIGQDVRFRFGFTSDRSVSNFGWYIDDLRVVGDKLPDGISAVAISDASSQEGDSGETLINFTIDIQPANDAPIVLERATSNGTAFAGLDFVALGGPVEIPAGTTQTTLTVAILGDTFFEGNETFGVTLTNPSSNAVITLAEATGTIIDDETPICLYEENFDTPGSSYIWSPAIPPGVVTDPGTINDLQLWHVQPAATSTCVTGADGYRSSGNALVFNNDAACTYYTPAGVEGFARTTSGIPIPGVDPGTGNPVPGVDALTAQLKFSHFLELEYNSIGSQPPRAFVEVSRTAGITWDTVAEYGPTAVSPEKYTIGWTDEEISLDDYIGETILVRFRFFQDADPNQTDAKGWYIDDVNVCYAARPASVSKLIVGDIAANEGDFSSTPLQFPVTIAPANASPITFSFRTEPTEGTDAATPDEDYLTTIEQVVIPAGTTSTTLDVLMVGDDKPEPDETFKVLLSNVSPNVFIVNEEVTGTITNDDIPSSFTLTPTLVNETAGLVTFTAEIVPPRSVPIAVNFETIDGSAVSGVGLDFEAKSGTLNFPANSSSRTFTVLIQNDNQYEDPNGLTPGKPNETFTIRLTSDSPYAEPLTDTTISIVDDETAAAGSTLTIDDVSIAEGSCAGISAAEPCDVLNTASFTVSIDPPNAGPIQMNYEVRGVTATAGTDFEVVSGVVTIPAGDTTATIDVDILADRAIEGNETFDVVLSNPVGQVSVLDNRGRGTISDDDFGGTAFGTSGNTARSRNLDSTTLSDPRNLSANLTLNAADFRDFDFSVLYGVDDTTVHAIDLVSGLVTTAADGTGTLTSTMTSIAYDHTNGLAYVATTGGEIYNVDLDTGVFDFETDLDLNIVAMAVHPTSGRIYAVVIGGTTNLYELVPGAWGFADLGPLAITPGNDVPSDNLWDADFDDATYALYLNAYVEDGGGDLWKTFRVSLTNLSTQTELENVVITPLAIASTAPPTSVLWSQDLDYATAEPRGGRLLPATEDATATDIKVSGVGDVNNDTYEDFILTAPDDNVGGLADAGRAWLVFGSPAQGPDFVSTVLAALSSGAVDLDATLLDGIEGAIITGATAGMRLGVSATGVGDMNGDQIADFAIGFQGSSNVGGAYLIYGSAEFLPAFSTAEIESGAVHGVRIFGFDANDYAGMALTGAGDMNGDGLGELAIGAPGAGPSGAPGPGAVYIIFGSRFGIGTNGVLGLNAMVSPRGITFRGENTAAAGQFGFSVSGVGDVNGDGLDDLGVGAPGTASTDAGAAYVIYGHVDYGNESEVPNIINLDQLDEIWPVPGTPAKRAFSKIIPAPGGLAEALSPDLAAISGDTAFVPGLRLTGETGSFGADISGLGDTNGDGADDFLVSAPEYDGSGGAEPHFGRFYLTLGDEGIESDLDAAEVGGAIKGMTLEGIDNGDFAAATPGISYAAGVGDINGDGLFDFAIGGGGATPGGLSGEVYLVYGRASVTGVLSLRDLGSPDTAAERGLYLYSTEPGATFALGSSISAGGDFNNDGIADWIVAHESGAFAIEGATTLDSAKYMNRMRSGVSSLGSGLPTGGIELGDDVVRNVGGTGDGTSSKPASGVRIQFTGGGVGATLVEPSTQQATIYRYASPDLATGSFDPDLDAGTTDPQKIADNNKWVPAGVHWLVQTDRDQFSSSKLEFSYRPEDIEGLDIERIGVFYSKNTGPLTKNSPWSWLPYEHDPDRRVFIVDRDHGNAPQEEFNGYYALVQADLVTELARVIPSIGVTTDNVYAYGPTVTPTGRTYWHQRDKKLYATGPGEVFIEWRNATGDTVSQVRAFNEWPSNESAFQSYVAGTPGVPLNDSPLINFQYASLMAKDTELISNPDLTSRTIGDAVTSDKVFVGQLTGTDPNTTARALLMLSDDASPAQGSLYFQFVKTIRWNGLLSLKDDTDGVPGISWNIGTIIDPTTDPAHYGTFHDESAGAPYTLFPNAPIAPDSVKYPGYYNRAQRTGSIVPVNKKFASNDDLVLAFYQRGTKLLDARTGNPVRNPQTLQSQQFFNWPHASTKYNLAWPTDARKIVIARQDGSREIDVATFGQTLNVYYQNDPALPGFNPNEEHAVIVPYGAGDAVFALRDDLNSTSTSEPFVLMTYNDPNDLLLDGTPRPKMLTFEVKKTDSFYVFGPWPNNLDGGKDPYEGKAGAFINAPYPISFYGYSVQNDYTSGPAWEDKNARHWARAAGDIVMKFFYPVQEGFYFPAAYRAKFPSKNFSVGGDDVPWLDGGIQNLNTTAPIDVTYRTDWPVDTPKINLGEVLIEAKFGLPQINGQCSVDFLYPQSGPPRAKLIDPTIGRKAFLAELPVGMDTATAADGSKTFNALPPSLNFRLSYNELTQTLQFKGILVDPVTGFDYVLINVINPSDEALIRSLSSATPWQDAIDDLVGAADPSDRTFGGATDTYDIQDSTVDPYDVLALTTGDAQDTGYVTLAFQNSESCGALPVSLAIIEVVANIEPGGIAVVNPACVFEEKLTLTQKSEFGGHPENFDFEWRYLPDEDGTIPDKPDDNDPNDPWLTPPLVDGDGVPVAASGNALNEIVIQGPGLLTLTDNWFVTRYKRSDEAAPWGNRWSDWTSPQLAPGWIKRVVGEINPFNQRASGGGIAGAEASFASFGAGAPNTLVSMISQAGPRYTGALPLNCDNLDAFGLIPIYQTVLNRGSDLSINSLSPIDNPNVNTALLLVASRISDLYMLLGNEAYADAEDPTIAFGTTDDTYGAQATSIHAFMNQTSSLLEEELALLRGRDGQYAPGTQLDPIYNRLIWNFTTDFTGGEVAYALNYNIKDQVVGGDGVISEADAKRLYPQGHGDAWGHYLTSLMTYYKLLNNPFYTWANRSEAVLVGGAPVTVDFIDERKFAKAAAARSQAGAEIVDLAYRDAYVEDPESIWQGYYDEDQDRAWGFADWASRAGQAAYIDWVVGNAIMRAEDPDPDAAGITKIDRTTVGELPEIAANYAVIEKQQDEADLGLNPLGLGTNVIPFDISPSDIDDGFTHFEQIYTRAVSSMGNAETVFNYANNSTQLLHKQNDSIEDFQRGVYDSEKDFNARLIEIFGYPYPEDIGPSGTYATGYAGPDLYHYMYADDTGWDRDEVIQQVYFGPTSNGDSGTNVPSINQSLLNFNADFAAVQGGGTAPTRPPVEINNGNITFEVQIKNYLTSIMAGSSNTTSPPNTGVLPADTITVKYNMRDTGGRLGIAKPEGWTERRAPGEIQIARSALLLALSDFMKAVDDYGSFAGDVQGKVDLIQARYNLNAAKLTLLNDRFDDKKTVQDVLFGIKIGQFALRTGATIAEKVADALQESVPTVTGIIVGFSNGVIIDGLSAVRGGLKGVGLAIVEGLKILADAAELATFRLEQEEARADDELNIDTTELDQSFEVLDAIKDLESLLRNEIPFRLALHNAYEAVQQASGNYLKVLAEGQRTIERLDIFRKQTQADVQGLRYRDMAFRIFRNDALQKYRAQFDMAQQSVYLAAKAYDYETTYLASDPKAGSRFLTDIVKARQLGTLQDGLPQTGVGLANSMAVMGRNFEVLKSQLGFNNPQVESNRFSLRYEKFRVLPGQEGNENWRNLLNGDYFENGEIGRVDNLWDLTEFRQYCVPPAGFGDVEPGIVISFPSVIKEGYNFFNQESGGLDSSYDATQFATKIRSVGVWFSNYDFLNLSNTPRVYLMPAGNDVLMSPTGFRGQQREFTVLDQIIPTPFPIGESELDNPYWVPSVDTLSGTFQPIRRYGRFRAYHDSGEFSPDETIRDSRLIGRSVWNRKWMLIIPASTLSSDRDEALETFINGQELGGTRDGNGVSDIKLFFETYAYPRLKSAPEGKAAQTLVVDTE
ncbi:MAG: hypothetical protein GC168_09485 [Candidatus Hydrogenedens sp.]|nr:hypothetical protein [Candidatus Hydrogenedens sp.]